MGSNTFDWNSPQFQNSSYHKWQAEGDTIEGVIVGMSSKTYPPKGVPGDKDYEPEKTCPVLCIDTAHGERELTIGQVDLLEKTKVKNPQEGDWYSAAWVATAGKKKIFLVAVKKAPTAPVHVPASIDVRMDGLAAAAKALTQEEAPF